MGTMGKRKSNKPWKADRQAKRREAAEARNARWAALSPDQQLDALDERFGEGVGATKQRIKLHNKLVEVSVASANKNARRR